MVRVKRLVIVLFMGSLLTQSFAVELSAPIIISVLGNGSLTANDQEVGVGERIPEEASLSANGRMVVKLVCRDMSVERFTVQAAPVSVAQKCGVTEEVSFLRADLPIIPGSLNDAGVKVLSPRNSFISTNNPIVRWKPIDWYEGDYSIAIFSDGGLVCLKKSSGSSLMFESVGDDKCRSLYPEIRYKIAVHAGEADLKKIDKSLLPYFYFSTEHKELEGKIQEINVQLRRMLDSDIESFIALTEELVLDELYSDGIDTLLNAYSSAQEKDRVYVYRRLGDLYAATGLLLQSQSYYGKAIELNEKLSQDKKDTYNAKRSQQRLARVYSCLQKIRVKGDKNVVCK